MFQITIPQVTKYVHRVLCAITSPPAPVVIGRGGIGCSRLKDVLVELNRIFHHHEIAILYENFSSIKQEVKKMLNTELNITHIKTIEESITSDDDFIVLDIDLNIASFESVAIVYLCGGDQGDTYSHYNITTRARTKLVIIDYNEFNTPPFL